MAPKRKLRLIASIVLSTAALAGCAAKRSAEPSDVRVASGGPPYTFILGMGRDDVLRTMGPPDRVIRVPPTRLDRARYGEWCRTVTWPMHDPIVVERWTYLFDPDSPHSSQRIAAFDETGRVVITIDRRGVGAMDDQSP